MKNWELASAEEFQPVPRLCRYYKETHGQSTPYMICLDHEKVDVVLAIRGPHLGNQCDYAVLFDNKLGQTTFDGGYVHNGLLNVVRWVFDAEHKVLKDLLERNPTYTLTFARHSLGAGVVALLTTVEF
ncbi:hypothetical protein Ancab_023339 [Ancistrocladus abbreviatus]